MIRSQTTGALCVALTLPLCACPQKDAPAVTPPTEGPDTAATVVAYENPGGMWMPGQMMAHAQTLEQLGVEFDPEALTDPTAFPLGAVVSLGGCSASFVSGEGLIVTNHHCVGGPLQHNSTPEQNLITGGFVARDLADEKWGGPNARVYVTTAFTDVSDKILPGLDAITDPVERFAELEKRTEAAEKTCEDASADTSCRLASYFEGAQFFAIESLAIKDVRLVYAPAAGIGVFGGEVDNWQWPRHTGDFAFLRAYVGPDGKPADYSPQNVPYKPPHHLKVAQGDLAPGDFAMVAGYPGRTYRLKTALEVGEAVQWYYPRDIERRTAYINMLETLTAGSEDLKIKANGQLRGLHNGLTNAKGMRDGLSTGGLWAKKQKLEAELQAWIDSDENRKARFGGVLAAMAEASKERIQWRDYDAAVSELERGSRLFGVASAIRGAAKKRGEGNAKDLGPMVRRLAAMSSSYDPVLDSATLELAIARVVALPADQQPTPVVTAILGKAAATDAAAVHKAVAALYAKTKLGDEAARLDMVRSSTSKELDRSKDAMLRVAKALEAATAERDNREKRYSGAMAALRPVYVEALRAYTNGPLAPDANGTLRLSFGTVRGYRPSPGADVYAPFTTLGEMVAKHTGTEPFNAPATALAAAKVADKSGWVDPALGDVPVNFLADLDITGGNSGSATLNSKGEIIGLAFDGNYESIASDWVFMPDVTRSIHVDMRYILWTMENVDHADRLIKEMGVAPRAAK